MSGRPRGFRGRLTAHHLEHGERMLIDKARLPDRIRAVIIAALAALALTAGPAPATPIAAQKYCGEFPGPAYKQVGLPPGSKYGVTVNGVTCGFASTWMRKLAGKSVKSYGTTLTGPAGWRCNSLALPRDWRKQAAAGLCRNGARLFSYSPLPLVG